MSIKDYEGGIITKNPTTPTGPYQDGTASGVWTMDQAAEYTKQGVWPTAGNISPEQYVDGLLSTYLYTGTGSALDIDNDLDLSGKGGLVWIKNRTNVSDHALFDTARGAEKLLFTSSNAAEQDRTADNDSLGAFNADGFSLQASTGNRTNESGSDFVSWSFLKKPGFFDIVTYTGTGSSPNTVSHNLGSVPGFIVVKAVSSTGNWCVAAYDGTNYRQLSLNSTDQSFASASVSNIATSTTIDVGYMGVNFDGSANASGVSYVGYLFAHDDQRFGDNANESIIKCGSYTGTGSAGLEVDLGFEPQWLMFKRTDSTSDWSMFDVMRGVVTGGDDARLRAQGSDAENTFNYVDVTATGFSLSYGGTDMNASGGTYIYIAIRRPMMTPTAGTDVFAIDTRNGSGTSTEPNYQTNFPVDMELAKEANSTSNWSNSARLIQGKYLVPNTTAAEGTQALYAFDYQNGWFASTATNANSYSWMFKRATGFFDVVADISTTSAARTISHNLGVPPEIIISKRRDGTSFWLVMDDTNYLRLNTNDGDLGTPIMSNFTATTFDIDAGTWSSGEKWIAYLFATLAGISKVGSYTGTAANLDVDCGFTSGARFILIKRTDSTGDWYVYDSERGIVAGNDPYLLINSTAAEVTSTDYIDPLSSGFTVTSSAPAGLNASGGTYIFLAIA